METSTNGSTVVDWRRDAPVLQHVELSDLVVLDQPRFATNSGESELEKLNYEVLIHGQRGPLLVRKQDSDSLRFALLFHSDHSTLPYRVGFPIFVANVVQLALQQAGLAEANADRTGVLPPLDARAESPLRREIAGTSNSIPSPPMNTEPSRACARRKSVIIPFWKTARRGEKSEPRCCRPRKHRSAAWSRFNSTNDCRSRRRRRS